MPAANGSGRRERFRGSRQCLHGDCGEGEAPLRKQDAAPASRQSCDARSRRDGGATSSGRHTCSRSWKSVQAGVMEGTQSALRQQRGPDGAGRQERRGALTDDRGLFLPPAQRSDTCATQVPFGSFGLRNINDTNTNFRYRTDACHLDPEECRRRLRASAPGTSRREHAGLRD